LSQFLPPSPKVGRRVGDEGDAAPIGVLRKLHIALKWHYQPQHQSRSWLATLRIQRLDIADLLEDNPSLKPYLETAIAKAYPRGLELAVKETNLPHRTFPTECPYGGLEILDDRFYLGEPSQLVEE
jgi:hypothetical protein